MSTSGSRVRVTFVGGDEVVVTTCGSARPTKPNVVTYASRGEGPDPAITEQARPTLERDPLVAALARYVEALHRRYPDGPDEMRERLAVAPDSANVVAMVRLTKDPAA